MKFIKIIFTIFIITLISCNNYNIYYINNANDNWEKYLKIDFKNTEIHKNKKYANPCYTLTMNKITKEYINLLEIEINYNYCSFDSTKLIQFDKSNNLFDEFNKGKKIIIKYTFPEIIDCSNEYQYDCEGNGGRCEPIGISSIKVNKIGIRQNYK